jgi:hypothetical protein
VPGLVAVVDEDEVIFHCHDHAGPFADLGFGSDPEPVEPMEAVAA